MQHTRFHIVALVLIAGLVLVWPHVYQRVHVSTDDNARVELPQNPVERARWWAEVQGPPATNAQIQRAQQAIDRQIKVMDRGDYRDAGVNAWEDLGPKNIGGRIRAIAINPDDTDEIFIGSVSGGIWLSTDGGTNWSETTPAPLAYPVTSIAIDPLNTDVMYASTGEFTATYYSWGTGNNLGWANPPGVGILKSTNGGSSWSITNAPDTTFLWLGKVIVNPLDPDILYAVGSTADSTQNADNRRAVFRSDDAGENWVQLLGGGPSPGHVYDIEINPSDTSELIIGTLFQALISTNSGTSWSSFMGSAPLVTTPSNLTGRRCDLSYCQSSPSTIFLLRYLVGTGATPGPATSEVWQTTDGGSNWSLLSSTSGGVNANILGSQGNYDNIIWADPSNCNQAIMGGINLWKWSNSTLTRISRWQDDIGGNANGNNNSLHADQHNIVPDPNYNGTSNTRVYIGNDGGIYKSDTIWGAMTNSGWESLNTELNITQFYAVDVSITGDTLVGGSQDNSYCVFRANDNNAQFWQVFSTGDGAHCGITKSNPEVIYSSTQSGNYYQSTDGGDTFCHLLSLNNSSILTSCPRTVQTDGPLFIAPFEIDPNDDQTLYAAGLNLWQSTNAGGGWSSIFTATSSISTIEIANGDANTVWVGLRNGQIWSTTNGGTGWSQVDATAMPNSIVTDLAINPNNHSEVMATFGGGFNNNRVWYTDDAGTTWANRSPNFDTRVYAVTWHPSNGNWVYIGTAFGTLASENDGLDWNITPLYNANNEGPVFTAIIELVWQGDGSDAYPYHLVAGTYGRGAWRTAFPIRSKYYVDKNCAPCGLGSLDEPYATFKEALEAAGSGAEIVFLSGGTYNEIPAGILIEKRIRVTLDDMSTPVVIE